MAHWFERNATPAIVTYTLVIVTATWAVSTFILKDNRIALAQSQLETQKALTDQWKQKTEILQKDLEAARSENAEYREWLGKIDGAIPAVMPRITELKNRISVLESQVKEPVPAGGLIEYRLAQLNSHGANVGSAFIHDTLGVIFTVKKTFPDSTAEVLVQLPDKPTPIEEKITPGKRWTFEVDGVTYGLIVTNIIFLADRVEFRIVRMEQPSKP